MLSLFSGNWSYVVFSVKSLDLSPAWYDDITIIYVDTVFAKVFGGYTLRLVCTKAFALIV